MANKDNETIRAYFCEPNRINRRDEKYAKAKALEMVVNIYRSDKAPIFKFLEILDFFPSSAALMKTYASVFKDDKSPFFSVISLSVETIANFMKGYENSLKKHGNAYKQKIIRELKELYEGNYFEDYRFSEYIVTEYINFDESPYTEDFLKKYELTEHVFSYLVTVALHLDGDLYDKYKEKAEKNKESRKAETKSRMEKMEIGVTTGHSFDGSKFDDVEFFACLPRFDLEVFSDLEIKKTPYVYSNLRNLANLLCENNPDEVVTYVLKTIDPRNFKNPRLTVIKEAEMKNTMYSVDGKETSEERNEIVIEYMKRRGIPFYTRAFYAVLKKYLKNGYKFDTKVKEKPKE